MSRMSEEFINTADDRAAADADEVAWLRHEVARLEGVVTRAALMLDEGDPIAMLAMLEGVLRDVRLEGHAMDVDELRVTLGRVRALLVAACP